MTQQSLYLKLWLPTTLLIILAFMLPTYLVLQPPSLGIQLMPSQEGEYLQVSRIDQTEMIKGELSVGDQIKGIRRVTDTEFVPLTRQTLIEEPDVIVEYEDYNRFFEQQSILFQLLHQSEVVLDTSAGEITITPKDRSLASIPFVFWFQLLCGLFTAITALSMFVFSKPSPAVKSLLVTGLSFYIVTIAAAPYSSRELVLDGPIFVTLTSMNHFGTLLFTGSFIALFWNYPQPLKKTNQLSVLSLLLIVYFLIWLADVGQLSGNNDNGLRWPILIGLLSSIVLGFIQWFRHRKKAVERAAMRWFFFSILIISSIYVFTLLGANFLGIDTKISQGYGFGILATMYLGLVLGVKRYRLFQLETWWTRIWLWLMAGAFILILDSFFVFIVQLNQSLALLGSVALAGWLYFPARQYLLHRLAGQGNKLDESLFSDIVSMGVSWSNTSLFQQQLTKTLDNLYHPIDITFSTDLKIENVQVSNDGTQLMIPSVNKLEAIKITMPNLGRRLFNNKDVDLAKQLVDLLNQVIDSQTSFHLGQQKERNRIYSDLHDDLGAKLLSLTYRAKDPEVTDLARSALQDLRDVVSRSARESATLGELIADWHAEIENRLESAGIDLDWSQVDDLDNTINSSLWALNLGRILREAVSNIIKHSQTKSVSIGIRKVAKGYKIMIEDFGNQVLQIQQLEGRGTANMKKRAEKLAAEIEWVLRPEGGCKVVLFIPLEF